MNPLLLSLGAGVLAGLVYALIRVRSPAPPAVALVGLLGMVIGSAIGGKLLHREASAYVPAEAASHVTAENLPRAPVMTTQRAGG